LSLDPEGFPCDFGGATGQFLLQVVLWRPVLEGDSTVIAPEKGFVGKQVESFREGLYVVKVVLWRYEDQDVADYFIRNVGERRHWCDLQVRLRRIGQQTRESSRKRRRRCQKLEAGVDVQTLDDCEVEM
jgi:ATP-dependent protease HslVU (ClpYQ) ATPase subunit